MTLSLFSSSKVLLIAIFVAHNLTIRACVLCGVSRVQLPRIVSDLGKTANYELMLTQIGKSTQSYPLQMQPLFSTQKERKQFAVELLLSTDEESTSEDGPLTEDDEQLKLKEVMMGMIRWYRNTLSPIMPPNCRFLPSCSNYALQAIDEQGPYRGLILTIWRILRCNPIGGSGYDPPTWPPPGFFAGSNSWRKK